MNTNHHRNYWHYNNPYRNSLLGPIENIALPETIPSIECAILVSEICDFILESILKKTKNYRAVLGLSGIDSAVSLFLLADAYESLPAHKKSGNDCILAVSFFGPGIDQSESQAAQDIIRLAQNRYPTAPIEFLKHPLDMDAEHERYYAFERALSNTDPTENPLLLVTHVIWSYLYTLAERHDFACVDTINQTEYWMSEYDTDLLGDIQLIGTLPKSVIHQIAKYFDLDEILERQSFDSCLQIPKTKNYFDQPLSSEQEQKVFYVVDQIFTCIEQNISVHDILETTNQSHALVSRLKQLYVMSQERLATTDMKMNTTKG